jgi:hypothetical protein
LIASSVLRTLFVRIFEIPAAGGGKKILVAAQWIATVQWEKLQRLRHNLSREAIKSGPELNPNKPDREYETQLSKHYGQENYLVMLMR